MSRQAATYDGHADWYDDYVNGAAAGHTERTSPRSPRCSDRPWRCLDVGCGSGVHSPVFRAQGWQAVGCDLSWGQLQHARSRLSVAVADVAHLPFRTSSLDVVAATLIHTDVQDWGAALREVTRVLRPGGRFVYVGVHPCFVGPFAQRAGDVVTIHPGYCRTELAFQGPGIGHGLRPRVGVRHRRLTELIGAVLAAGLALTLLDESGPGPTPDLLAMAAFAPGEEGSVHEVTGTPP